MHVEQQRRTKPITTGYEKHIEGSEIGAVVSHEAVFHLRVRHREAEGRHPADRLMPNHPPVVRSWSRLKRIGIARVFSWSWIWMGRAHLPADVPFVAVEVYDEATVARSNARSADARCEGIHRKVRILSEINLGTTTEIFWPS